MKKHISFYTAIFFVSALIFTSCEDVIDLELKNTEPAIVIEASISEDQESFEVKLTRSAGFYELGNYPKIEDASVVLTSNNGVNEALVYTGDGIYKAENIHGTVGETYTLTVNADGNTYTASNTIPDMTLLDSIDYEWTENPHSSGYMINMYFMDTPGIKNYYRVKVLVDNMLGRNQQEGPDYMLYEDKIFDGRATKLPAIRGGSLLKESDTVTVELYAISKATFDYYNTVRNVIASDNSGRNTGQNMMNGSSAPANPLSNFSNGALGYFGAYSVSRKTVIIRP